MSFPLSRPGRGDSSTRGFVAIVAAAALIGLGTVGRAQSPAVQRTVCQNPPNCVCPAGSPVDCGVGCCDLGETCNTVNPLLCCPANLPVSCQNTCCAAGSTCSADGTNCGASCPVGFPVDCNTGFCCQAGQTCNSVSPGLCCPSGFPVACKNVCCAPGGHCTPDGNSCAATCPAGYPVDCNTGFCCQAGQTCNPVNSQVCCPAGFPVACRYVCCQAGYACSADGTSCVNPNPCTDPFYPGDCGNGFCCPAGDRCQDVLVGDVIYPYCCLELPDDNCCSFSRTPALAESLGATRIALSERHDESGHGHSSSQCRKSTKVRPFDVLQVSSSSTGSSFDSAQHQYSVAFALKGKKSHGGQDVVLKVPLIPEDSNASTLSVMIPPFLLEDSSHGKADVFVITDGVVSDTCISRVRIAKLPKSASKIPGLVTLSWLRANQTIYSTAKPSLTSAAAAPFVNPEILADVDTAIAKVGELIPSFDLGKGARSRGNPLVATAKQADSLVTGILLAGQKIGDAGFSTASSGLLQAISNASDSNDGAMKAAEVVYANTVLTASGASAQSVAKFTVACGAVTSAGVGATSTFFSGAASASAAIDAQAAANAVCGATVAATTVITGVTAVAVGATIAQGTGLAAYGKTLLQGSAHVAASTRINYGGANLATAKLCTCSQTIVKRVIDICITVITTCDHTRRVAPKFCLATGPAQPAPFSNPTTTTTIPTVGQCDAKQVAGGDTPDTRNIELGKTSGTFDFDYETFSIKDRIIVSYAGTQLLDTGCVGEQMTKTLSYSGSSTQVTVQVIPNCDGSTGTQWEYTVHCPQ